MGFVWGRWRHYGLALLYPLLVLGALTLIAAAADLTCSGGSEVPSPLFLVTVSAFSRRHLTP
ncbi:MAG TPA: hypothetical protein VFE28_09545 [Candidatus Krumholzibacteria bacterium]|nr:hypothetical protein [Candidatus Krumholzibacteria bacterium]